MGSRLGIRIAFAVSVMMLLSQAPAWPVQGAEHGWTTTGRLKTKRWAHTATPLPDGRVLVAGGINYFDPEGEQILPFAEVYDPASRAWKITADMGTARVDHTATLLPDGRVLVAGGFSYGSQYLSSAEIYDPATGTWTPTGSMGTARSGHTATRLPDGRVLVAGGIREILRTTDSAEIYNPATGSWTPTGSLGTARYGQTATRLPDGRVLVTGGCRLERVWPSGVCRYLSTAEIYDPATGAWTWAGSKMTFKRIWHTATRLPDGRVLVAGGYNGSYDFGSAEIYDPDTGTWTLTGSMTTPRDRHTATRLPDGRVLVAGGSGSDAGWLASAEIYDPAAGTWSLTDSMTTARFDHTATRLREGGVLVAGGFFNVSSCEIFG